MAKINENSGAIKKSALNFIKNYLENMTNLIKVVIVYNIK